MGVSKKLLVPSVKVRSEIAMRRNTMETEFIKGIRELETVAADTLTKRSGAKQHQAAYLAFRQAEIDAIVL